MNKVNSVRVSFLRAVLAIASLASFVLASGAGNHWH